MKLLLVRHGIALDRGDWSGSDAERPLTDKGREKMKENAKGMKRLGIELDVILTSPYRRAHDTAVIIAKEFGKKDALHISGFLKPDSDPDKLIHQITKDFKSAESVMVVGHEPYLSKLLSVLIGGKDLSVEFKKGGLAMLSTESESLGSCAMLEAFIPPRLLRLKSFSP